MDIHLDLSTLQSLLQLDDWMDRNTWLASFHGKCRLPRWPPDTRFGGAELSRLRVREVARNDDLLGNPAPCLADEYRWHQVSAAG